MARVPGRIWASNSSFVHGEGPFEFGRGPRGDLERYIIEDPCVSRNQLRVQEIPGRRVRIENVSRTNPVLLDDGKRIETGTSVQLLPPVSLYVGITTIRSILKERGCERLSSSTSSHSRRPWQLENAVGEADAVAADGLGFSRGRCPTFSTARPTRRMIGLTWARYSC
jgi:hypothetical protein